MRGKLHSASNRAMKPRSASASLALNELVHLVEASEVVPRLERGGRQGAIAGQLNTGGHVADGNEPVSSTLHDFITQH